MANVGDLIDGKYKILNLHDRGGMSRIWLAQDQRLNKLWAIKEVGKDAADADSQVNIDSFIKEANLMKDLDHPQLPRIVDIIDTGSTIYIVMDFIQGETLKSVLKRQGHAMKEEDVFDWGKQLCNILNYLHTPDPAKNKPMVIYRDMKPGNVMLKEDGTLVLIDFGIARKYDPDKVADTVVMGTKGYAAPEVTTTNVQTSPRTDVYSLGVTLYHLVTNIAPSTVTHFPPIREINPQLSEGLEKILLKAMNENPAERYADCYEMLYDLENPPGVDPIKLSRVRNFKIMRNTAIGLAVVGVLLIASSMVLRSQSYNSYIDDYNKASSVQTKMDALSAAAAIDPSQIEPYQLFLETIYDDDNVISSSEYSKYDQLMRGNENALINKVEYADLCYNYALDLYLGYQNSDGSDPGVQERLKHAQYWFDKAIEAHDNNASTAMSTSAYNRAVAYSAIADFYSSYDSETEDADPMECWNAFKTALESLNNDQNSKQTIYAKLRLCQTITNTLSVPKFINSFAMATNGLTEQDALAMLGVNGASSSTVSVSSVLQSISTILPNETATELYNSIMGDLSSAESQVKTVFAASSRSSSSTASSSSQSGNAGNTSKGGN